MSKVSTKVLVCDGLDKELFESLKANPAFDVHPSAKNTQEQIQELLPQMEALVIRSATSVSADTLEKAPNLKYVIRAGEGTDNIDKKSCALKGVKVSNTPGANNNSAAEHAFALMMSTLRKVPWANAKMTAGGWDKSLYVGNELWQKTVGIVGFGRIGQILAKRLQGFDVNVLFYDPFITESDLPYAKAAKDLNEVFSKSDIVSIHVPLMEQTKNLITKSELSLMKKQAILINAARGKIVNEDDLYETLKNKNIKAAAFDVFATEPLEAESKLRTLDNLILTPHVGASTEEAQIRVGQMVLNQLSEFFEKNNLLNEVKS
ncbi:hydroxyacid dehydrogenase [bacterium]|nr:hydroxyacid dehydrogenase [bacterium]